MIYFYIFSPLLLLIVLMLVSIISWRLRFAIFVDEDEMPNETLKGKHDDWPWIVRWVPRRWSAILNDAAQKHCWPKQLLGSNNRIDGHQDIPLPGTWCLSWPFHFASVSSEGFLFAIGVRKDYYGDNPDTTDGDDYWTLRLAAKRFNPSYLRYLETLRPENYDAE